MKNLLAVVIFASFALAQLNDKFDSQYPASQRIQISQPRPVIAKWITQGLTTGPHWQLLSYQAGMALSFTIVGADPLSKTETQRDIRRSRKLRNVYRVGLVLTLHSLVSSTLSFEGAKPSTGDSCVIAAGFKFSGPDGSPLLSSGKMEVEFLQRFIDTHNTVWITRNPAKLNRQISGN